MSDYAERVRAYEARILHDATRCTLCPEPAAFLLSWRSGCYTMHGLAYCDPCGRGVQSRMKKKNQCQLDDLTPELVAARVAYQRERYPMPYRSTVGVVA